MGSFQSLQSPSSHRCENHTCSGWLQIAVGYSAINVVQPLATPRPHISFSTQRRTSTNGAGNNDLCFIRPLAFAHEQALPDKMASLQGNLSLLVSTI
jgi:hypothetical protein